MFFSLAWVCTLGIFFAVQFQSLAVIRSLRPKQEAV